MDTIWRSLFPLCHHKALQGTEAFPYIKIFFKANRQDKTTDATTLTRTMQELICRLVSHFFINEQNPVALLGYSTPHFFS